MPKLPLFKDTPLDSGVVEFLRQVFKQTDAKNNFGLMDDLDSISQNPEYPMPLRLAYFVCFELTLINSGYLQNFVVNSSGSPEFVIRKVQSGQPKSKRDKMVLEINEWILAHAKAAGFSPKNAFPSVEAWLSSLRDVSNSSTEAFDYAKKSYAEDVATNSFAAPSGAKSL